MKNSMNSITGQKGMTLFGILFIVMVVIFTVLVVIRLVPPYFDYSQVKESLEILAQDSKAATMSKAQIREMFSRRLQVNNIKNVDANLLEIENENGKKVYSINYETRVHVMGNVDAVMTFQTQAKEGEGG